MIAPSPFGELLDAPLPAPSIAPGLPADPCAGLFGQPATRDAASMRDYWRLLAIRAQARS